VQSPTTTARWLTMVGLDVFVERLKFEQTVLCKQLLVMLLLLLMLILTMMMLAYGYYCS